MKSTVFCLALAVVGWMEFGNSRVAFAQDGPDHQTVQREDGMTPPPQHPDAGRPMPMRKPWLGKPGAELRCIVGIVRAFVVVWLVCNVLLAS
jgi:hypothetical protein